MSELELREISNGHKKDLDWIRGQIGREFSLWQSIKLGGTGSPRIFYSEGHLGLDKVRHSISGSDYSNIHLYPDGILIRMNINTKVYALPLQFKALGRIRLTIDSHNVRNCLLEIEIPGSPSLQFYVKYERSQSLVAFLTKRSFNKRFVLERL